MTINHQSTQTLRILHTNDLHSHFEQMPKIASCFKELKRRYAGEAILTLDIGDHMDRMRLETEGTNGSANIEVMNATGYEAMVPGNNEGLTYDHESLRELFEKHALFPVIGSNIEDTLTGKTPGWMLPYHLIRKGELTVGLIGLTVAFTDYYQLLGWDVRDPMESAAWWVDKLRPQCDVLIVLSHLGIRYDERLAEEIDGIDVILGAHTHHLLEEPLLIRNTLVCAAGKYGNYAGEVKVEVDLTQRRILRMSGRVHPMSEWEDDPVIHEILSRNMELGRRALDIHVAELAGPLELDWYRESALGNLLASALRRWMSAEIGLVNAGQLLRGLAAGPVTLGHLLAICPGPINPCRVKLAGDKLRQALEESLLPEFQEKPIRGYGFRGEVLGMLCIDGMTVRYDPEGEPMNRITEAFIGDEPLEDRRIYSVGMIDMFTFGVGYMSLSEGSDVEYLLPELLRDILREELRLGEHLEEAEEPRWYPFAGKQPLQE
ncbi:bifunctional metallophosphatase/5'-nucleotidase [Paenibacillus lutrae]|uniref:Bifunctional metallophosphatase/5'-nucleotidase n=1 Tax=Paenibacillus lutrae TaxID=2078573 RepID=A0A7X3K090_9BACL|nr:bifunctional UDP-sugar hydrolase/5'-nucleotidase [Paenibacillus lutrae]MVP00850.1 bifunctional metallophosphatase/5'-nucleotidase [Paenibacillus lutrae]